MTGAASVARLLPGVPLVESPLFPSDALAADLSSFERSIARQLHSTGFACLDFPDPELDARIERIRDCLGRSFDLGQWRDHVWAGGGGLRIQDAWKINADVRAIATNEAIVDLLTRIYGRRAFPFQTLNFPVGTQQKVHSDSVHFSSVPERFLCGVWLALEDIDPRAGPLVYYPGSHKWPILTNEMLARRVGWAPEMEAQGAFEATWEALIAASGIEPVSFLPRKGQALIWAANLLHGGSAQTDPGLTRWSQVTHYYFEGCAYYTPAFSDAALGNLALRQVVDVSSGRRVRNRYLGKELSDPLGRYARALRRRLPNWR
jgi:hypothetical protein